MRHCQGLAVHEAESAEEGLDKFTRLKPDIVVTDMLMRGHNGLWLAEQVRKINKNVIIILMSAYHDDESMYDIPGLISIPKPIDAHLLRSVLVNCMETARLKRELSSLVKVIIKGGM